jgi:hypothetical protein
VSVEYPGVEARASTSKAYLCEINGTDYWVPKSHIERLDDFGLIVSDWWDEHKEPTAGATRTSTRDVGVLFSQEQMKIVNRVVGVVKRETGDPKISISRVIELVCADYLAGVTEEEF